MVTVEFAILWYFRKSHTFGFYFHFPGKCGKGRKHSSSNAPPLPCSAFREGSPGRADSTVSSIWGVQTPPFVSKRRCFRKGNGGGGLVEYSWLFPTSVTCGSGVREKSPSLSFNSVNGHSLLVF